MGTEGEDGRVIADRYRLRARLGRGGMGVVWRATDELLGRQVAVKEIALDEGPDEAEVRRQRDRSLREARAVAQLRHPHIVVVHDVVEQDGHPYMVMELIDGGSLADRVARWGPVDAAEAARIGLALLGALRAAHTAGVLHRDIKPANVLVESGTDRVVLTDFGIAQVAGATTLTETGSFVGSPEYTAPERMAGAGTGPASDLWSLGALLCTILSGESPFRRDSLGGILHAVVSDEIRVPAQAEPILPVVRGLLERDPDRRMDATEAERLLRAYLDTGRTPAPAAPSHPPTRADTARPPERKAPSARGVLMAALLVAAMAGAGVSAAALLMHERGGGGTPASSAPVSPATSGSGTSGPSSAGPSPTTTSSPGTSSPGVPTASTTAPRGASGVSGSRATAPSGYRLTEDPAGFRLAVPDGFVRRPQGERVFYLSPGGTFRLGVKPGAPVPGGPPAVLRRADAAGPDTNPGYRDARVFETTHRGAPAAFWEFTWNGFSAAEGPRHTYDLCWEEGGRMYDVWVSAPVGQAHEAREYFDVAVGTFAGL
ncbi:serine/threonine-protein kinase [Streptomyces sp. MUM 2J]|uniref:serine/threonine-protein kinase n=1 Tax=Streptomyces sp. MUM 2J TaxID=2791987 RepID=UPI001F0411EB|nr:serine/threonine-protein kinase [Streptomyces sp. MUM 2J]MCH0563372.1 serine/threonine protein kinase [Streptomyces sp. MUM 2J]